MCERQLAEIQEIVDSVKTSVQVVAIYVFGSVAKGLADENSDYDFYVVIPDNIGMREREANWAIRESLIGKQKRSIDMLVGTVSKFERRKAYLYSIENEVAETGVKVYG